MWLGEQITSRGIGNGISLIIFAGIVAQLPLGFGWYALSLVAQALCQLYLLWLIYYGRGRNCVYRIY